METHKEKLTPAERRLLEIVDDCKTQTEAAERLGVSSVRVYALTKRLGITKWRQKNRIHVETKKRRHVCEVCGREFTVEFYASNPGRFCSRQCLGKHLGNTYGFGLQRRKDVPND